MPSASAPSPVNHVQLAGRLSADPETKELPSGDVIVTFRLVVRRDRTARRGRTASRQTVDTIECVAWTAGLRRRVGRLAAGDEIEVTGALRRRFSRAGGGVQSFVTVELASFSAR